MGGETTVTIHDGGLGGRNQELALAAAIALDGHPNKIIASFATDGDDGPTPAAGAVVSGETVMSGRGLSINPLDYLARNDSYNYFKHLDETLPANQYTLLQPGPTGTNVNDLLFILTYPD